MVQVKPWKPLLADRKHHVAKLTLIDQWNCKLGYTVSINSEYYFETTSRNTNYISLGCLLKFMLWLYIHNNDYIIHFVMDIHVSAR